MATSVEYDARQRVDDICSQESKTTVMFVGAPGAGKSSLINSLINIIDNTRDPSKKGINRYIPTAPPDLMSGHSLIREQVRLTDALTVVDNRGWQNWEKSEALKELAAQINAQRSFVDIVDWEQEEVEETFLEVPLVLAEKINCITIVINGKGGLGALKGFEKLVKTCNKETGRKPSVVVTHKDKMNEEQVKNIRSTLETEYGIGRERVFVIKNITDPDNNLDDDSKASLLDFLERCFTDGIAGSSYHRSKDKQRESRVEYKKKVEAFKAADKKKRNAEAVEASAQELELVRSVQEKMRLEIETNKAKVLGEIEEGKLNDERKHLKNMQAKKEESYLMLQKLERENELQAMKYSADMHAKELIKALEKLNT